MLICLPYSVTGQLFQSDYGQTLLQIAYMLQHLGHTVILACISQEIWWSDALTLQSFFTIQSLTESSSLAFDILIDVGANTSPKVRSYLCSKSIIGFLYDPVLFHEIQSSSYIDFTIHRHIQRGGLTEIWMWDCENAPTLVPCLEAMFSCPVQRMPFFWSSCIISDISKNALCSFAGDTSSLACVIYEDNAENTRSCAFPLACVNAWKTEQYGDVSSCIVYDTTQLVSLKYFQENILQHCSFQEKLCIKGYNGFAGFAGFLNDCSSHILLTHLRFRQISLRILNSLWLGIPLVHNSEYLKNSGFDINYYKNNSVEECLRAIKRVHEKWSQEEAKKFRDLAETAWPLSSASSVWETSLTSLLLSPSSISSEEDKKNIIVSFSDMWEGFNVYNNAFLELLRSRGKWNSVTGVYGFCKSASLHICGPFGQEWYSISQQSSVPIVFFSGEQWKRSADMERYISLFLTHDPLEDDQHIRFPLWILYLDIFNNMKMHSKNQYNPNRLPFRYALEPQAADWKGRKQFCAFVVSNPTNTIRNRAFEALNNYKYVNSGGSYRNSIGGPIEHFYGGGGGGDVAKYEFLRDHQFCICYENGSALGYVTEKLLHAKLAGCIPLYWGDEHALTDFDPNGFVNLCGKEPEEIVEIVDMLLKDQEKCMQIANLPAIGEKEFQQVFGILEKVGSALEKLIGVETVSKQEPSFSIQKEENSPMNNIPLYVSFSTKSYLDSIEKSLQTLSSIRKQSPLDYLLYTGNDVEEKDIAVLQTKYPWIQVCSLPTDPVDGFPDFWNPEHFGWKLWIYNEIIHEFVNRLIIYSDAGIQWLQPCQELMQNAWTNGVCFFLDEQINRFWCSPEMVQEMNVSEEELTEKQILGGLLAMKGGHPDACAFFKKALAYGQNPINLVGKKLITILSNGQNIGHRHDQSILSVERLRSGKSFGVLCAKEYISIESLRRCHLEQKPIYIHREMHCHNHTFVPNVDDIWIVNLDRREDRWKKFQENCRDFADVGQRFSAVDGKSLQVTQSIAQLFAKNDFHWKKSVMGCALSHILLWLQLVCEGPGVQSYLIFEDDAKCEPDWKEKIFKIFEQIPKDAELAYLGGILPGNKAAYNEVLKPVNDYWATIAPNTLFSKDPMPIFHFCTYSYYITRSGAQKLLDALLFPGPGCFTSIDHYLGHPQMGLKKYVLQMPVFGCFQEDDPQYIQSEFDNFDRVDTFDSDIWNNKEVCTPDERKGFDLTKPLPSLYFIIFDILRQMKTNVQTRTLLDPRFYMQWLLMRKHIDELRIVQAFLQQFQEGQSQSQSQQLTFQERSNVWCAMPTTALTHAINEFKLMDFPGIIITNIHNSADIQKAFANSKFHIIEFMDNSIELYHIVIRAGAIPLFVRREGDEEIWKQISQIYAPVEFKNWVHVCKFMNILLQDPEKGELYRKGLQEKCRQYNK